MSKLNTDTVKYPPAEEKDTCVSIGKIQEDTQLTTMDTGWGEEQKERMKKSGYDNLDIVREWYS